MALFGLRGVGHAWVAGVTAVVLAVLAGIFGLVAAGWATSAATALLFATGGSLAARALHVWWPPIAMLFAGLGLFLGMVWHRRLSVVLPPLFAAVFIAWGCAIAWAPNWRGAILWQLNDLDWVLGLAAIVAAILLALSLERDHRQKLALASRTRQMEDEELKQKIVRDQAALERFERVNPPDEQ